MKIIISHDVDHIYPSDHIFNDLIFPKLWVRSFLELLTKKITIKIFCYRLFSIFDKRLNRIPEIIKYDISKDIFSTFFFGMDNALGLSYTIKNAKEWIDYVINNGFDVGVHGIDYKNPENEYNIFKKITELEYFGIRTHYVRYDSETFLKFAEIGYIFDCSEFCKQEINIKDVYKVGAMWEFPLHVMDGYILKNGIDNAKRVTKKALIDADKMNIKYFSLLFHDYLFNEKTYPMQKEYYEWFVDYCVGNNYKFTSYKAAIDELNNYG